MSMLLRRAMMMASSLVKHIVSSVTGLASFSTNVAADMPSVLCEFAPVQTGSGDPSPSNVRPISGWSNIDVWVQSAYDTSANPSATTPLGGTYYGGTLDVATGVLTVTYGITKLKDMNWTYQSAQTRFYSNTLAGVIDAPTNNANMPDAYCECYKPNTFSYYSSGELSFATSGNAFIKDSGYTDKTTWLAAVGEYAIVYNLKTTQTYQLTANQIASLIGTNNVWHNANGGITVEYYDNQ